MKQKTNPKIPRTTVGAFIFNSKGELFLMQQPKWHNRLVVPCGHVEFGESLIDAVKREAKEETGLKVEKVNFLRIIELINSPEYHDKNRHFICMNYLCQTDDTKVILNKEGVKHIWINPEKALALDLDSVTRESIETYLVYRK